MVEELLRGNGGLEPHGGRQETGPEHSLLRVREGLAGSWIRLSTPRAARPPFGVSTLLVLLGVGWVLSDRLNADAA